MTVVRALDHFVLRVRDLEASLAFYEGQLGLAVEGREQHRRGEKPFVSLRIGESLLDLVPDPTYDVELATNLSGFVHFCLTLADLDDTILRLRAAGVRFLHDAPVPRGGARGVGPSIYALDPDGYVVELKQWRDPPP
jgi:catechol 2,3-dioxygenase-like lactoylglutathione lyase family enzyme